MGFKAVLESYCRLHALRYEVNQREDTDKVAMKTGSINEGQIIAWKPSVMIPNDLIARSLNTRKHPIRPTIPVWKFWKYSRRKQVVKELELIQEQFTRARPSAHLYCHRFDLMDLTRSIAPAFIVAPKRYEKQWKGYTEPNGPVYINASEIQSFIHKLFQEVGGRLDQSQQILQKLGPFYLDLSHIGWEEKFAKLVTATFKSHKQQDLVVTKEGIEATREMGISRLLAALNLTDHVFLGIREKTATGAPRYLLPYSYFSYVDWDDIRKPEEIVAFQRIGLVLALIHAQDAKWCNFGFIELRNVEDLIDPKNVGFQLRAYDLGKSLIPAKAVVGIDHKDDFYGPVQMKITLCTAVLDDCRHFDSPIPQSVLAPFLAKNFQNVFSKPVLPYYLEPNDPLCKDPTLLKKAEEQLQERATKLRTLLIEKQEFVTMNDVFHALYPDEMLFVDTAKKLKIFHYDAIFPKTIVYHAILAKERFEKKELQSLYDALDRLEKEIMPHKQYFPLWHEPINFEN